MSLRPESPDDEPFILALYASTRETEMALVPWDDAQKDAFLRQQSHAQRTHYRQVYPDAQYSVVTFDGDPIGRLYLARGDDFWNVLDIAILPERRNAGIGTYLMRQVMAEAAAAGKPVRLHVETFNPAFAFYERLGFTRGEVLGIHARYTWDSATAGPGAMRDASSVNAVDRRVES